MQGQGWRGGVTWARPWLSSSPVGRQQQGEGLVEVQQEAEEDHSDHAGFWCRLLADGRRVQLPPAPQPMMGAALE